MAALTLGNPIKITGALATSYKAQLSAASPNAGINNTSYGTLTTLKVAKIMWFNPITVGDTINIGDPNSGLSLLQLRCETANQTQVVDWTASPVLWNDFEINSFPSGTLYIWTEG